MAWTSPRPVQAQFVDDDAAVGVGAGVEAQVQRRRRDVGGLVRQGEGLERTPPKNKRSNFETRESLKKN